MNRLLLFAGAVRRDGWVTLDGNPDRGCDITALVPPLPPEVTERRWDAVEWVHGIGSIYPWDAATLLAELRAVLSPDGVLMLEQPDAGLVAQAMLLNPRFVWWMFGDPSFREPLHMNRWAYTPASLEAAVREAGFTRVDVVPPRRHPERDFRLEARP